MSAGMMDVSNQAEAKRLLANPHVRMTHKEYVHLTGVAYPTHHPDLEVLPRGQEDQHG